MTGVKGSGNLPGPIRGALRATLRILARTVARDGSVAPAQSALEASVPGQMYASDSGVAACPTSMATPSRLVENDLAEPHGLGRHLDAFILDNELQSLFEGEL